LNGISKTFKLVDRRGGQASNIGVPIMHKTCRSPHRVKYWPRPVALLIALQVISACSLNDPSATSNKLETDIVPKIIEWSKSAETPLDLSSLLNPQVIDAVCIVPDYNCIDTIERNNLVSSVDRYHSSFGKCVDEGKSAIVLVSNNTAHAALIHKNDLDFALPYVGRCVEASGATFKSRSKSPTGVPIVSLEGK